MSPQAALAASLGAVAAVAWLMFLTLGTTRGSFKRAAFRLTLLGALVGLGLFGRWSGLFAQVGSGRFVLLATAAVLAMSYLYLIRFCPSCGRLHRNFKLAECARCGAPLPESGLTNRPRGAVRPRGSLLGLKRPGGEADLSGGEEGSRQLPPK